VEAGRHRPPGAPDREVRAAAASAEARGPSGPSATSSGVAGVTAPRRCFTASTYPCSVQPGARRSRHRLRPRSWSRVEGRARAGVRRRHAAQRIVRHPRSTGGNVEARWRASMASGWSRSPGEQRAPLRPNRPGGENGLAPGSKALKPSSDRETAPSRPQQAHQPIARCWRTLRAGLSGAETAFTGRAGVPAEANGRKAARRREATRLRTRERL
jgi:hypothetical protein